MATMMVCEPYLLGKEIHSVNVDRKDYSTSVKIVNRDGSINTISFSGNYASSLQKSS